MTWRLALSLLLLSLVGCGGGDGPDMSSVVIPLETVGDDCGYFGTLNTIWQVPGSTSWLFGHYDRGLFGVESYWGFMRFPIDLLAGTTIITAAIDVVSYDCTGYNGDFTAVIALIDADDCDTLLNQLDGPPWDPDVIGLTGDEVNWALDAWLDGEDHSTPDLAAMLQAYIDRDGYSPEQYIGLLVTPGDAGDNELRIADSGDDVNLPILRVTYKGPQLAGTPGREQLAGSPADEKLAGTPGRLHLVGTPGAKKLTGTPGRRQF